MNPDQIYNHKELEMLKMALEHTPVAVFIMDNKWNFEYINPEFERLSGYNKNDLINKNISETLYKKINGLPESFQTIIDCLNNGKSWKGELLTINRNGNEYWANTTATPYKNEQNETLGYVVIQHDITEQKKLIATLKGREQLHQTLVEDAQEGVAIVQDYKFLYINKVFCEIFGYSIEELHELGPQILIAPEDNKRILEFYAKRSKGEDAPKNYQGTFIRKDKSRFICEINASTVTINDKRASFISMKDITKKLEMENALRESEKKYKTLVENSLDGIMIVRENRILFTNDTFCNMLGYTCEIIRSLPSTNFIHPEDRHLAMAISERRKQGDNSTVKDNFRLICADGKIIECEVYSSVIEYEEKIASFFTIHDVTENRKMQRAIAEKEILYRTLIEKSHDGVILTNKQKFFLVNQAFCDMLGYTKEEIMKTYPLDLVAPEAKDKVLNIHNRRIEGKITESITFVAPFRHKSGKKVIVEINSSTVKIEGTNLSFVTLHDITNKIHLQEELERSEQKYRQLTEMLPQAVYELDLEGNITYMNETGLNKFGLQKKDFGVSAFSCIIEEDHNRMRTNMLKIIHEDFRTPGNNYTAIRRNGEAFPVLIFAASMKKNGKVIGTRGIIIDMTEHEAMQNALRESEKKYRELTELLPQTVYELDLEGNILYFNQTGFDQFGIDSSDLGSSSYQFIAPEQHDHLRTNMHQTITEKKHSKGNKYTAIRKNGETFPAMTFAGPLIKNNQVVGVRGIILDMTENEAMERALRESEEKYKNLIEKATDGIIITQDGILKYTNDAMSEMLQYTMEEMINHSFFDFVPASDHEEMIEYHFRRMNGERFNVLYRSHIIRKDKKIITVELNARTLDYEGKPAAFIVIRDITERLFIEDELKKAKAELEGLNKNLEARIKESSDNLTEAKTQLIRLQKEKLQSQFEVLRQQVNPHFLFNSLNVLTSLIKLEPDLAEKFTEHLSKVYRYVLENKDNDLVDLKTELDFLDAYLFLLNIRFTDKIAVNIDIPQEKTDLFILPLALQLLIENAIKHNTMSKKAPLNIRIFIDENNFLNVINNLQERESYIVSTGVGLKNIEHRYVLLELPAPDFIKTEDSFIAKIPLKENYQQISK